MEGPDIDDPKARGIIPRIVHTIFEYILLAPETIEFTVRVSYIEIYLERIRDLFDGVLRILCWDEIESHLHSIVSSMNDPTDYICTQMQRITFKYMKILKKEST